MTAVVADIKRRGILLVLSSPSGAGKTTIARALVEHDERLTLSISVTTRPRRNGESHGKDYHFVDSKSFEAMVRAGALLEHATVFGHDYGTPRVPVVAAIEAGRDIVTDIDWQGTQQLKEQIREDLVSVFILPPSLKALESRLRSRAQDTAEVVHVRMAKSSGEMSHWCEYDYVLVNDDIDESVRRVRAILIAERARPQRQVGLAEFVNRMRGV